MIISISVTVAYKSSILTSRLKQSLFVFYSQLQSFKSSRPTAVRLKRQATVFDKRTFDNRSRYCPWHHGGIQKFYFDFTIETKPVCLL